MKTLGRLGRGWRVAAGATLLLVLLAWQLPLLSQTRQPRETRIQLSWQPGWTPAGISVERGDTLSIRARTIKGAAEEAQPVCERNPATGVPGRCREVERREGTLPDAILDFAARQAIFGRVGEGKPFAVGRNFKKVMRAGGPLSLRWNVPREAARAPGFDVIIKVEPGIDGGGEGNLVVTNGSGTGGEVLNNTHSDLPTNNMAEIANNGAGVEPANLQENVAGAEENIAAPAVDPIGPGPPEDKTSDVDSNVSAADTETSLSVAQTVLLAALLAAVLLALVGAGLGAQRWRRRRLVDRTRARLGVAPSLDLGEGDCRGGGRPAGGPAASLRARLEEGALHSGGGRDG